jgi:hypothetical protein
MRRGQSASQTHCKNGHEFTPENTYHYRGLRHCRACNLSNVRRYKAHLGKLK